MEEKRMRRSLTLAAALMIALLPIQAFSQSSNARLSGTIEDASGAVLPGVVLTATNTGTNITTTTTSNAAGVYNFPALQPGVYRVTAELTGFQTQTKTDVQLGNAAQIRLNFTLQVRRLEQSVEVSVASDMLLLQSSSSTGSVLSEDKVSALPLVSNNALDLIKVMGGAVVGMNPVWDADTTAFAGVRAANINVQRDGITVNDVRYPTGVNAATRLNPDLIGEFRMLLSPVDAEVGRGNGQVQVMTRSGANTYHGSAVWYLRNSYLDANTWYNNAYKINAPYSNQNEYSISAGGPIIKNKTFFFVLWDQQLTLQRAPINPIVLTPCARKGIFRYYDNWNNGNVLQSMTLGGTPTIRVVNLDGTPTAQYIPYLDPSNPNSGPHNGILRYASVFAPLANTPTAPDCSDAQFVQGAATWDKYRTGRDPTGWLDGTFMKYMPPAPNNYEVGDGLNVAGYRWNRRLHGASNLWGIGEDNNRKQINVRIDHNLSASNRINGSLSFQRDWADDSFVNWPQAWGGKNDLKPMVLTVNFTSTLKPTLLNELRFGTMRTGTNVYMPLEAPGSADALKPLFPNINGLTTLIGLGSAGANFTLQGTSHFYGTSGLLPITDRDSSPRWTFGDTLSWSKGRHGFKGGGEVRLQSSREQVAGTWAGYTAYPYAAGGTAPYAQMNANAMPSGMVGISGASGNRFNFEGLLNFLSGAVGQFREYYYINSPNQTTWSDPRKEPAQIRDIYSKELSFFFKDDWKVTDTLTLNLGVRYDYFGVPHIKSGLSAAMKGGALSVFGPGLGFNNWMKPGAGDPSFRTQLTFVGPGSPNSGLQPFPGDKNNFGPAVGFSWQLPWLGKGKTTIRGGYQLSYTPNGRLGDFAPILGGQPGMTYSAVWSGDATSKPYLNLTNVTDASPVPLPSGIVPLLPIPVTDRSQSISAVDPNLRSPYIQNLTFAVTRNVGSKLTVDVRYIGTLTRKLSGSMNINIPNFVGNGLRDAFDAARRGGESALLDTMFRGLTNPATNPTGSGAQHLRTATFSASSIFLFSPAFTYLANGDYQNLANILNTTSANCGSPGCLLRNGGFAENFIKSNPQFNAANFYSNYGNSNYNGLQAQLTLRPTGGVSFQGTYTWSRNLGYDTNSGFTDPRNRRADYTLLSMHRLHTFTTYGTFDLPFGPNRFLLKSNNGVVSRIVGGWQMSWTGNINTGMPTTIGSQSMLYGRGVPDRVGSFDPQQVDIVWKDGAISGNYFANRYTKGRDPQCTNSSIVAPSLQASCTLSAVFDASSGQPVLVNPMPGTRGNLGLMNLFMPTVWNVDMAMSKSIRVSEGKSFSLRIDVVNVFNHVVVSGWGDIRTRRTTQRVDTAGPPDVLLTNSNPFGDLPAKVGARMFQARARFDF
jgi:hypothetical protein